MDNRFKIGDLVKFKYKTGFFRIVDIKHRYLNTEFYSNPKEMFYFVFEDSPNKGEYYNTILHYKKVYKSDGTIVNGKKIDQGDSSFFELAIPYLTDLMKVYHSMIEFEKTLNHY